LHLDEVSRLLFQRRLLSSEAVWVRRLRESLSGLDSLVQLAVTQEYARAHRLAKARGRAADTRYLDALMALKPWNSENKVLWQVVEPGYMTTNRVFMGTLFFPRLELTNWVTRKLRGRNTADDITWRDFVVEADELTTKTGKPWISTPHFEIEEALKRPSITLRGTGNIEGNDGQE